MAHVLIVATTDEPISALSDLVRGAGHAVATERDFHGAIASLSRQTPELVISQVRLGEYNGLHLMIRVQLAHPAVRVILLGNSDSVLEADAHRHGAVYLVDPDAGTLLGHISRVLGETSPHRRFPRKAVTAGELVASVGRGTVRVIDLSYGGLRVEVSDPSEVEAGLAVVVPDAGVAVRARPVWTRRAPTGQFWCGVELTEPDPQALSDWRRLVDSVAAA